MSRYNITSTVFLVLLILSLIMDRPLDIPGWWYVVLVGCFLLISAVGSVVLSMQYYTPVIYSGRNGTGIALSFDDGPVIGKTDRVLDILKAFDAKAAFFCIGKRVAEHPGLLRRIDEEGHIIGNHSYFHGATFDLQSAVAISRELGDTDRIIQRTTGKRPRFFRPPYGVTNPPVVKAIRARNYKTIGWSVRSFDTVIRDRERLFRRVTRPLKDGDIILFHDHCEATLEILPRLLEHIKKSGLKVVRLDELINEKAYA